MPDLDLLTWNVRYFGHGSKGLRATAPSAAARTHVRASMKFTG